MSCRCNPFVVRKFCKHERAEAIETLLCVADRELATGAVWSEERNPELDPFSGLAGMAWRECWVERIGIDALEAAYLLMDGWDPGEPVFNLHTGEVES